MTIDTQALPLLPLTTGVVLPGMVVTLTLESREARPPPSRPPTRGDTAPARPAHSTDRYARGRHGRQDRGRRRACRNGMEALVIRGLHRAVVGTGVAGTGDATWVQVEPAAETNDDTERAKELAREYRGRHRDHRRGPRRSAGRRVPPRHRRSRRARRHRRLLARPRLRAEDRGPRDARRRGTAREGAGLGARRPSPTSS